MLIDILILIMAYLLGSFNSAVVISHVMGFTDPRTQGSGNPGATNVLRLGGTKAAIVTLLLDISKGVIAVGVALLLNLSTVSIALVGFTVFIGHLFPLFFHFKGGKGVATAFGVIVMFNSLAGLTTLATWLLVAVISRYSSLSALIAGTLAPLYLYLWHAPVAYWATDILISLLLIWRHRSNIHKLLNGQESKIGAKKSADVSSD
ncbi:glycerol-3-phosphate 1-O-acyltransferase PlsY [Beggiatoa leptomitoformis]|uniref:Glycerol-3-phosphate acyltransferase n=1 Tax=Beggiatoa leptomitoformis TaxID=288004 RepID=A0A2N9YH99_9GAMM|nr:glycerol-3-phosphate 1-O-acyltransferase PlsY [Beggiatoa leptomitoformis]ALG67957.1 glycerol-3-phosphate 1-O-acyltransferase PlsY [Beggiatoa leptomitoformis]AUI69765.1 glycerol-3-phosphate 1-O-acyltransferase PlsY [Beggiatoa leptomitoformis]